MANLYTASPSRFGTCVATHDPSIPPTPVPPVPPATVNYQGDGITRKKRRNRTHEMFADIERTLRAEIYGEEIPAVELESVATVGTADAVSGHASESIDAALRELTRVSEGYADLSSRVAKIRAEVAAYEAKKQREADDDDDEFLMMH